MKLLHILFNMVARLREILWRCAQFQSYGGLESLLLWRGRPLSEEAHANAAALLRRCALAGSRFARRRSVQLEARGCFVVARFAVEESLAVVASLRIGTRARGGHCQDSRARCRGTWWLICGRRRRKSACASRRTLSPGSRGKAFPAPPAAAAFGSSKNRSGVAGVVNTKAHRLAALCAQNLPLGSAVRRAV